MSNRAFFSYSRSDDRIANWLHGALDRYRTPKALIGIEGALGPVPAKLHPIFRDRTDLSGGGHLNERIETALRDSECLVVLCTPSSARSPWVNREVEIFLELGREKQIFPVIADGEPESGDPETECFPPALRGKGLLAADLREIRLPNGRLVGDGRDGGRLKLLAGLLGVSLDALVQRERRRERLVRTGFVAATIVFASLAIAAGGLGWLAQTRAVAEREARLAADRFALEAQTQRDEAQVQRSRADEEALAAIANAREAERQSGVASENARRARSNLLRLFARRAEQQNAAGDPQSAMRYALAGAALSADLPELREDFRSQLSAALYAAGPEPLETFESDEDAAFSYGEATSNGVWFVTSTHTARDEASVHKVGGRPLALRLPGTLIGADFSADGAYLTTATSSGVVQVWRLSDGHLQSSTQPRFQDDQEAVIGVRFSEDASLVASYWCARRRPDPGDTCKRWLVRSDAWRAERRHRRCRLLIHGQGVGGCRL